MNPQELAATAAIAALAVLTLGYMMLCFARPFRDCWRCDGTGRVGYWIGRGWRFCPHCHGTGLRLRIGRRVWNYARRLHAEGGEAKREQTSLENQNRKR